MRNWGYKNIDGAMALMDNYGRLVYDLETLIAQGLSAAIIHKPLMSKVK